MSKTLIIISNVSSEDTKNVFGVTVLSEKPIHVFYTRNKTDFFAARNDFSSCTYEIYKWDSFLKGPTCISYEHIHFAYTLLLDNFSTKHYLVISGINW